MDALKRAVKLAGSQGALAEKVNVLRPETEKVGQTAVSNWVQRGTVPPDNVIDVARAVDYRVTPHQLRPDLYPHPDDGLPAELRNQAIPQPNIQEAA